MKRSADRPGSPPAEASRGRSSGLKAGFSDDNRQYNYFLQFLSKYRDEAQSYRIAVQERIILNVRDSRGRTLPDAVVTVSAGDRSLVSGRTYADGSFLFFPSEYDSGLKRYRFDIRYGAAQKTVEAERGGKREIQESLDVLKPDPQTVPIDLLFILDTTGSMGEEIERLKQTIDLLYAQIEEREKIKHKTLYELQDQIMKVQCLISRASYGYEKSPFIKSSLDKAWIDLEQEKVKEEINSFKDVSYLNTRLVYMIGKYKEEKGKHDLIKKK